MPIQLSGSLVITGSITTTGVITMSGSIASASYSSTSDLLQGTGSVGFATTASFNAVSSSQQQISASYIALSASYNTFSGSASTRITVDSASLLQVSSSQQQISASLLNVISIFATTGSNSFRATQSITGSLTVTGQIIAQTLNVQQVTSSIIYSSGSNNFGCDLNSRQTFTGSVLITGSLNTAGTISGTTIFGSTIACSPIGCFATSCATAFIGGTMSGTTIYGSTAVCSPVGKFTSCIDAGSGMFSSSVTAGGSLTINVPTDNTTVGIFHAGGGTANRGLKISTFASVNDNAGVRLDAQTTTGGATLVLATAGTDRLTISSTGIATFACQVCSPNHIASSTCSTAGLRVYGASGTHQWDMYLNGANLRFSDNTSGGCLVVDSLSTFSSTITAVDINIKTSDPSITLTPNSGTYAFFQKLSTANGDYLRLYDGTAYSMRFINGNVGLNVVPTENLDIYGAVIKLQGGAGVTPFGIANNNNSGFRIYDYTAGVDRMIITCAGNVGIGTGTPSSYGGYLNTTLQSTGASGVNLDFKTCAGTREGVLLLASGSEFALIAATAIPLTFRTIDTERMRITACGTVKTQCNQALGALETCGTIANNNCVSLNLNSAGGNGSIGFIAIGAARTDTTACQAVRLFSQSHTNGYNTYTSIQGTNDGGITITNNANGGEIIYNCSGATINYVVRYINLISLNSIFERQ